MLSKIQKRKFKKICGISFDLFNGISGEFFTARPYQDKEWEFTPLYFKYRIDIESNKLYCSLWGRFTDYRYFGWDETGVELNEKEIKKALK